MEEVLGEIIKCLKGMGTHVPLGEICSRCPWSFSSPPGSAAADNDDRITPPPPVPAMLPGLAAASASGVGVGVGVAARLR